MSKSSPPPQEPEGRDVFVLLGERLIARADQQPIQVTIQFADGVRVFEIGPKYRWFKALSKRRNASLRGALAKLRRVTCGDTDE